MGVPPDDQLRPGPRVCLIGGNPWYTLRFRSELIQSLADAGCLVSVIVTDEHPSAARALSLMSCSVHTLSIKRTGLNPFADLVALLRYWSLLRRVGPDIVLAYGMKPMIYGAFAARIGCRAKFYSLVTGRGQAFSRTSLRQSVIFQLIRALCWIALRTNRAVFFQNAEDREEFVRWGMVSLGRSHLVSGSGINLVHFPEVPWKQSPIAFLLISRLIENKGIREFVRAARTVRSRHPDVQFQLLGAIDKNRSAIPMATVREWHDAGFVEYLGETDDVRPYLAKCAVFVLPSAYGEGVPRSILEALAVGRAVITSDTPGCRTTVVEGENGYLVPPNDDAALTAAIRRFVDSPSLIEKMGRASRTLAEQRFDVRVVNRIMLAVLLS